MMVHVKSGIVTVVISICCRKIVKMNFRNYNVKGTRLFVVLIRLIYV